MKTVLVAKRPFKSAGKFYDVGSIIKDPTNIKYVQDKLDDNILIRVSAKDITNTADYIKARSNKDIKQKLIEALKEDTSIKKEASKDKKPDKKEKSEDKKVIDKSPKPAIIKQLKSR